MFLLAVIFLACVGILAGWQLAAVLPTARPQQQAHTAQQFFPQQNLTPQPSSIAAPLPTQIPSEKILSGGSHMFQTFNNCGPASLSMALSHYGVRQSQAEIGQALRPYQHPTGDNDDKSVTLAELAAYAAEQGLIPYHRPAGSVELLQQFIAADIPVITRTWLEPADDIGHYRVVIGYDQVRHILIQDDSLQGAGLEYTETDFLELWQAFNYEFLVLVRPEQRQVAERLLGELRDERQAWQRALALADQQRTIHSADIYAQFNRSVALHHLGRFAEAIQEFEGVKQQLPPRMLWYQIEPLLAYYAVGDFDRVLQLSDQILNNQNRAFSELYVLKGTIFEQRGDTTAAQQAFELARTYNSGKHWRVNVPL